MTKSFKINLIFILTLLLSTITLFFCMLNTDVVKQAAADEEITVPTTYTVADKSDFYFTEGAWVNTEATGIRFMAEVTKGYYDELTNNGTQEVVFYAVVNGASASAENAQIKPFAVQPTFAANAEDSETFSLFITIKYNEYIPTNGSFDKAYMTELLADAYVLKADNTWVKAYSPENNQRSMRIVANAAYLMQLEDEANGGSEEVEYKEQLANYFKSELTTRTSEEMAYVLSNGSGKMYLPELSGDSYVGAYIGTKNVASTITDNVITLANVDLTDKNEGDLQNITALTKNGGLYTMKVAYATAALTLNTVDSILTATDGYYVLADDIDMSGKTWNPENHFNGTLNGLGFTIDNLKPSAQTGLFKSLNGTAKNIFMKNVDTSAGSGVFGNRIQTESTIENVDVSFAKTSSNYAGGLLRILDFKKTLTLKDVVIVMPSRVTSETGFVAGRSNSEVVLDNCIFIGGNGQIAGTNASYVGTVSGTQNIYDSVGALLEKLDKKEVTLSETMTQKVYLAAGIQEINQDNAESIFKENASGYYFLTGDITLSESYEATSGTKFSGTLDGRKHTITVKNGKGMFYDLGGTLKNVTIIKNTNTTAGYGAVAKRERDSATLDNVYLHVGGTIGDSGGGIVSVVLNKLTLNNVVVRTTMSDNPSRGAVAFKGQTVTATNLYVVGSLGISGNSYSTTPLKINDTVIDSADDRKLTGISITGVMFSSSADFKTFYSTGYNNLTEYLQTQCEKYLGAEKEGSVATKFAIVIPENTNQTGELYLAGQELQLLFKEATGATAPIVSENNLGNYVVEHIFSLGETYLFQQNNLSLTQELGDTGYIIKSVNGNLFISGNTDVGTLFGVYGYLEKEFNFDCFDVDCYYIDNNIEYEFVEYNLTEIPYMNYRANGNKFILSDKTTMYRMRYTDRNYDKFSVGSASMHTVFTILPKNTYYSSNSNWYSDDGTQLCYTAHGNAQDLALMKQTVFEYAKTKLKSNLTGKVFIIGSEDQYTWCSCSACLAEINEYGAESGSAIAFCNDIADMIYEWFATQEGSVYARDNFKVMYVAYNKGLKAPKSSKITCNDNVTVCFAPLQMDFMQKIDSKYNSADSVADFYQYYQDWKTVCSEMSYFIYQINYESPLAFFDTYDFMIDFYRRICDEDVFYMFDYGHRDTNETATGFQVYKNYLAYKLSLNAGDYLSSDEEYNTYVESITDDFFDNYFGPSAQSMRSLFDSLSNSTRYKLLNWGGELMTDYISESWQNVKIAKGPSIVYRDAFVFTETGDPFYNNPEMFDEWINLINQALSDIEYLRDTDNELYQKYYDRIALERICVYYMAIECYPNRYSNVEEMKSTVKEDALRFGITMYDLADGTDGKGYVENLYS